MEYLLARHPACLCLALGGGGGGMRAGVDGGGGRAPSAVLVGQWDAHPRGLPWSARGPSKPVPSHRRLTVSEVWGRGEGPGAKS